MPEISAEMIERCAKPLYEACVDELCNVENIVTAVLTASGLLDRKCEGCKWWKDDRPTSRFTFEGACDNAECPVLDCDHDFGCNQWKERGGE